MPLGMAVAGQEARVRDQGSDCTSGPNVRVQTPVSASRSPVPKVFKVFVDPAVTMKAPARFEGEIIGHWFCPLHSAALWLLEHGLASHDDTIEVWREGRGRPDYVLERATVERASRLRVIEGEVIHTAGEWGARQLARSARTPAGVAA